MNNGIRKSLFVNHHFNNLVKKHQWILKIGRKFDKDWDFYVISITSTQIVIKLQGDND